MEPFRWRVAWFVMIALACCATATAQTGDLRPEQTAAMTDVDRGNQPRGELLDALQFPAARPGQGFDARFWYDWMAARSRDIELPPFPDDLPKTDLDPDVIQWASDIARDRHGIRQQDLLPFLAEKQFSWIGAEQQFFLTPKSNVVETSLENGDQLIVRLRDEYLTSDGEVDIRVRPCRELQADEPEDLWQATDTCFSLESSAGFDTLSFLELTVIPGVPMDAKEIEHYAMVAEYPSRPLHASGLFSAELVLPVEPTNPGGGAQSLTTRQLLWGETEVPERPLGEGDVARTGTVIKVKKAPQPVEDCVYIYSDGSYHTTDKNLRLGTPVPGYRKSKATDSVPVFRLCKRREFKEFFKAGTPSIIFDDSKIASEFAAVWRQLTDTVTGFPYVGGNRYRFKTIEVVVKNVTAKDCGTADLNGAFEIQPPATLAGAPELSIQPQITLHLNKRVGTKLERNDDCFPKDGSRVDFGATFGHEVAHVLLDFNRLYWTEREYNNLKDQSLDITHTLLELPPWAHEMVAAWAEEQLNDQRPSHQVGESFGYSFLAKGMSDLQGNQHPVDKLLHSHMGERSGGYNLPVLLNYLIENNGGRRVESPTRTQTDAALADFLGQGLRNIHVECFAAITKQRRGGADEVDHYCSNERTSGYWAMRDVTRLQRDEMLAQFALQLLGCETEAHRDATPDAKGRALTELQIDPQSNFLNADYLSRNFICRRAARTSPWFVESFRIKGYPLDFGSSIGIFDRLASAPSMRRYGITRGSLSTTLNGFYDVAGLATFLGDFPVGKSAQLRHVIEFPVSRSRTALYGKIGLSGCHKDGGGVLLYQPGANMGCVAAQPNVFTLIDNVGQDAAGYAQMELLSGSLFAHSIRIDDGRGSHELRKLAGEASRSGNDYTYYLGFDFWCLPADSRLPKHRDRNCRNIDALLIVESRDGRIVTSDRVNLHDYSAPRQTRVRNRMLPVSYKVKLGLETKKLDVGWLHLILINHDKIENRSKLSDFRKDSSWPIQATQFGLAVRIGTEIAKQCKENEIEGPDGNCLCAPERFSGSDEEYSMVGWKPEHRTDAEGQPECRMVPPCKPDEYWLGDEAGGGQCRRCPGLAGRVFREYYGSGEFIGHFRCVDCLSDAQKSETQAARWYVKDAGWSANYQPGAAASCGCPDENFNLKFLGLDDKIGTKAHYEFQLANNYCFFPCYTEYLNDKHQMNVTAAHVWDFTKPGCQLVDARTQNAAKCCSACVTTGAPDSVGPAVSREVGNKTISDVFTTCETCKSGSYFVRYAEIGGARIIRGVCTPPTWFADGYFTRQKSQPYNTLQACPPGQTRSASDPTECQAKCSGGQNWNVNAQRCECPSGMTLRSGQCQCPSGTVPASSGVGCRAELRCDPGEVKIGGRCLTEGIEVDAIQWGNGTWSWARNGQFWRSAAGPPPCPSSRPKRTLCKTDYWDPAVPGSPTGNVIGKWFACSASSTKTYPRIVSRDGGPLVSWDHSRRREINYCCPSGTSRLVSQQGKWLCR